MFIKSRWLVVFAVFGFLCGHTLSAQTKETGTIEGTVVEHRTGDLLQGAAVWVLGTTFGASADSAGRFIIRNVPPGIYPLLTRYVGFASRRDDSISVCPNETVHVDIRLLDYCESWADIARKDLAAGRVFLLSGGLIVHEITGDELKKLQRKYGFEDRDMGCEFICEGFYNEVVEKYLEARNGAGWWDRYNAEYEELKKRLREAAGNGHRATP